VASLASALTLALLSPPYFIIWHALRINIAHLRCSTLRAAPQLRYQRWRWRWHQHGALGALASNGGAEAARRGEHTGRAKGDRWKNRMKTAWG